MGPLPQLLAWLVMDKPVKTSGCRGVGSSICQVWLKQWFTWSVGASGLQTNESIQTNSNETNGQQNSVWLHLIDLCCLMSIFLWLVLLPMKGCLASSLWDMVLTLLLSPNVISIFIYQVQFPSSLAAHMVCGNSPGRIILIFWRESDGEPGLITYPL